MAGIIGLAGLIKSIVCIHVEWFSSVLLFSYSILSLISLYFVQPFLLDAITEDVNGLPYKDMCNNKG